MNELNPALWVSEYGDQLYAYVMARIREEATAQDIVQETFFKALKNRAQFNGKASEKTWLFAVCKNLVIDHFRALKRKMEMESPELSFFFDEVEHWRKETAPSKRAMDRLEEKEFAEILLRCRKKLKKLQESVFVLKYMEDLSSEEICKVLSITPSNYWVLMHRAKLNLRHCIEKNEGYGEGK